MKKGLFISVFLIICMCISGCSKNNLENDVTNRKLDINETKSKRVNDNTRNQGGPAITSVDTSDPELDRKRTQHSTQIHYSSSKIIVANQAAKKVTDLSKIDHANIIVTDNNAYVAVKMTGTDHRLTPTVRKEITKAVKAADPNIDTVYISKHPQFYKQMMRYTKVIQDGRTNNNLIGEFSDTIRRIFPDAR
ncbi:YhcN/YlaJ family sporulation lipoprotein [Neobacillus vireti]|uniref:YhcN/YlaJ family sporulation lipoprotein n=1 Tax=Neobacillus vireti TaxID=220686 RepID=UPI002FFE337C